VGTVGKMPMPRQVTTQSVSFFSLRPCAFALFSFSLLPFPALAGYPPKTEAIQDCCNHKGNFVLWQAVKLRRFKWEI